MPEVHVTLAHRHRFNNLHAVLSAFESKAELASVVGRSVSLLQGVLGPEGCKGPEAAAKRIGERLARTLETELSLPSGVLDVPNGVASHIEDLRHRRLNGVASQQVQATAIALPTLQKSGLQPLHLATLDTLRRAMSEGRLTERDCLRLLNEWTPSQGQAAA